MTFLIGGAAQAEIGGTYRSPLGKIAITEKGGSVTGRLVGKSPCGFKKGTVILRGDRLDDSLTGEVKTCKIGKGCKGAIDGLAMLLVTRNGGVISGYVHVDAGQCKTPLTKSAVAFKRKGGGKAKKESATSSSAESKGNAKGERTATRSATKGKQRTTEKRASSGKRRGGEKSAAGRRKTRGQGGKSKARTGDRARAKNNDDSQSVDSEARAESRSATNDEDADKKHSLEEGEPPVSPGPQARAHAERLATEGHRILSEPAKAREKFEEAVEVDPAYAEGWNGIGVTYYLSDRYEEAEENYKHALEADPALPDAYYNLACLYALNNETDKAFNYLRISVLNGFVSFASVEQDPDLNNLHNDERYTKFRKGDLW